jgi:hypothetical protein
VPRWPDMTTAERLLAKSERDEETGCLRWTGVHTPKGYGRIRVAGRDRFVHQVAHEVWIGPIPSGMEVDHVAAVGCAHRDCIEPRHLESVTPPRASPVLCEPLRYGRRERTTRMPASGSRAIAVTLTCSSTATRAAI